MLKIQVYKWYGLRLGKQHSILRSSVQFSSFYFSSSSIHIYNQHKLEKPVWEYNEMMRRCIMHHAILQIYVRPSCRSLTQLLVKRRWTPWGVLEIFLNRYVLPRFSEVGSPEQISWLETGVSGTNFCQNLYPRSWNLAKICKNWA